MFCRYSNPGTMMFPFLEAIPVSMMPCPAHHTPIPFPLVFRKYGVFLFLLYLMVISGNATVAQCTRQERFYATSESHTSGVANWERAMDNDPLTASTFSAALLSSASQSLTFSQSITAGTAVTVKLSPPSGTLNLLVTMSIQPYTVHPVTGVKTPVGDAFGGTTLLGLLSSSGSMEVTFVPKNSSGTPVAYQGVTITLGGLTLTTVYLQVFHAFVMKDATGNIACNQVVDYLSGVKASGLDLATGLSRVTNQQLAGDVDLNTYADLQADVNLLNPVFETVIFKTPSVPGDSIRIILKDPKILLLTLELLSGFAIQPYLGQTAVGSPLTSSSSLLNLQLLSGGSDNQYVLTAAIPASFDRVEITITGVANVLRNLYVYDVRRAAKVPAFDFTLGGLPGSNPVCITRVNGLLYTITGGESCATYRWYDAADLLLTAGGTFTPVITTAGNYTYYVAAQRDGCTNLETKKKITLDVSPLPGPPTLTIQTNP